MPLLTPASIIISLVLTLSVFPAVQSQAPASETSLRMRVIQLVNIERRKVDLRPVRNNRLLQRSAEGHAKDMFVRQFFNHRNPDGKRSKDRIKATGYGATCNCNRYYGENIARGQRTPEEVVRDWMNSPSHKENILSPNYKEIGIGIEGDFWVQNFGGIHR